MNFLELQKVMREFSLSMARAEGIKPGAKYARKFYEPIKKALPLEGTVSGAVKSFDDSLSAKEHLAVCKAIQRLLDEDGITPPYR